MGRQKLMQAETERISFWAQCMHKNQLALLIRRFKKDPSYLDKLFESGNHSVAFPGVLEDFRNALEQTHQKGATSVIYSLALTWININPIDLHKAYDYLCSVPEECPHYEKAQIKRSAIKAHISAHSQQYKK